MDKKILIVEDERDMREAMSDALKKEGYEVFEAENGRDGLQLAIKHEPDLILLDLLMPVMGGQEMLKQLRLYAWGRQAKVIILSAMDDVENIGHGFEKGIVDYIIKSNISLSELSLKVKKGIFGVDK